MKRVFNRSILDPKIWLCKKGGITGRGSSMTKAARDFHKMYRIAHRVMKIYLKMKRQRRNDKTSEME